jgi:hypothetical protein
MKMYYTNTTQKALDATPNKLGKKPPLEDTRGSDKIEIDYFRFYQSLFRKEVDEWKQAREARRDPFRPITFHIQQLYTDCMLDNHLQGAIENRILRIINKDFNLNAPDGTIDRKRSACIQTQWFRQIIRRAMESKFYGYSLLFVQNLNLPNRKIIDLPRENIIPEKEILLKNALDPHSHAIKYKEFPNYFLYIQLGADAIGILERIAPLTIFKRHSWAAWDEFEQIFGIPVRVARTAIQTQKHKDELQSWLENMGTLSYAIFDKQTDIEIKENSKSDAFNVFLQKISIINKEISKGIVGQTMTMDDGSSLSQSEVHLSIYNEITTSDIQDIQDWTNDCLFPVLRAWGMDIPEGYYMTIVEKELSNPNEKIKIDSVLLQNGYNIKTEYIENFYGTPLDEKEPRAKLSDTQLSENNADKHSHLLDFFP